MKNLFVTLVVLMPISSFSADSYNPSTGVVHIPIVHVGANDYEVEMIHLGDSVFKVTSTALVSDTSKSVDTLNWATGILRMPNVSVGGDTLEVNMMHQGDLVFKLESVKSIDESEDTVAREIRFVIQNLAKAKFSPVRVGWQFDYGFTESAGLLNTFEYVRSLITFETLQKILPMDIYVSGPHSKQELKLTDHNDFGHYNPQFVRYFHTVVDWVVSDESFMSATRDIMMEHTVILSLQRMQHIHRFIENNKEIFQQSKAQYEQRIREQTCPERGCGVRLPKAIAEERQYRNWAESVYAFWVRREIDGTKHLWIDVVDDVLRAYSVDSNQLELSGGI